jgi:hypothetical protein
MLLVAGCASVRPPTAPEATPPPPSPLEPPTAAELRSRLSAHSVALRSFQGQGHLEYEGPDGKMRSSHMVVVNAPNKVRIDFRSPFSITYTVVTDGNELLAYDRGEKVLYRGVPTPANLGRFVRVPVDLEMLALLVRGIPPLPAGAGAGSVRLVDSEWLWEMPLAGGARMRLTFDQSGLKPRKAVLKGAGAADFSAYFSGYEDVGGVQAAHEIRAELPDGGHVQLTYGTIWRDRKHSDNAFTLVPPEGVRVVEMGE